VLLAKKLAPLCLNNMYFARETHGLHLYLPCWECAKKTGARELTSRHMTINVDRFLGEGRFRRLRGTYDGDRSAMCMKEERGTKVSKLLRQPSLESLGLTDWVGEVHMYAKERFLIDDGRGNMIPDHPGEVIPLTELPEDHVAIQYLRERQYDPAALVEQFRCGWCVAEKTAKHRRMPGGFKDTPQGRIVFFCDMLGVQQGWQGRILDRVEGDGHFYWHPYEERWVLVEVKLGRAWIRQMEFLDSKEEDLIWKPSKYKTASSMARNECLMGLDAAIRWNASRPGKRRVAVLGEGPLDAGRFCAPGIPLLGKFLSQAQARILAKHFDEIIWVGDTDSVGRRATAQVKAELAGKVVTRILALPSSIKDAGELEPAIAQCLFETMLS
jgi:hypothetical protein